jgi:GTP-binding protein
VLLDEGNYNRRMVVADIPGLVEGAHTGYGLGHRFLKHVERTRFLVHILSVQDMPEDDPFAGFALINNELAEFSPELAKRRQIEVVNKIDLLSDEQLSRLRKKAEEEGRAVFFLSARNEEGIEPIVSMMWRLQAELDKHTPLSDFTRADAPSCLPGESHDAAGKKISGDTGDDAFDIRTIYCK